MRRLLVVLAILAALLVGADAAARSFAETAVAGELEARLERGAEPTVSFGGWPFLTQALSGRLSSVTASVDALKARDVTLRDVRVVLEDVAFSAGDLLSRDTSSVVARGVRGTASLSVAELNAALERQGARVTLDIEGGRVAVRSDAVDVEAGGEVSLERSSLVIAPSGATGARASQRAEIELPRPFRGLAYESARVVEDRVVLSFRATGGRFELDRLQQS